MKQPKKPERKENGSTQIHWHPAFIAALQFELENYRNCLEFHTEYQLTAEPLRIDCLVTKTGDIISIQAIDSRYLNTDENLWLKSLSNRLDTVGVILLGKEAQQRETARIRTYMDVIMDANKKAVEEAFKMRKNKETLDEMFERIGVAARFEEK